ncbi:HD family phosphohydrolase [Lacrimispora sp.]|uniref:HD family phosphohydrolase n=1 Tax=Lacrimispora sp. TaxID=2719234 RepID=UPI00289FD2BB|nr:HD family phosphohydrolase [Lacrimispora sp.]
MDSMHLTREEKEEAIRWAEDSSWVEREDYCEDTDYMDCVRDIIDSPVFQSMENYMQHGDTSCKAHCIKVSYMGYCICRKMGWDYAEVARAGLLHDLFLYDWHTHAKETGEHFHGFTHPRTALNNAVKYFDLTEKEKNMILRHMWPLTPIPPKSREGMVIIYSDKFCGLIETMARIKRWILFGFGKKSAA